MTVTASDRGALKHKGTESGGATGVAALLTFLFGVMMMGDHPAVAIALPIVTSLLLVSKGRQHTLTLRVSPEDNNVAL